MQKKIITLIVSLTMFIGLSPTLVLAQQDTTNDLELRVAKLEAQIESMSEDMANWKTFLANFQKGAQEINLSKEAVTHNIDLGMTGQTPTRGVGSAVVYTAGVVADWVITEGAEKLGTMVGEWEAGPPSELQQPQADQKPQSDNYSTSGQQGQAGQR